jgi:hypothetical protein
MACEIKATIEQQEIRATLSDQTIEPKVNAIKVPYYGQMSSQTPQTLDITTQGVYTPMTITGTFDTANAQGTVAPTTGTFGIKNISGNTLRFMVIATADVEIGNNKTAGLRLAVNGVALTETTCQAQTGNHNLAKLMTQWMVNLPNNGEITYLLANISSAADITVDRAKIVAVMV